jgi:hypothetical protein
MRPAGGSQTSLVEKPIHQRAKKAKKAAASSGPGDKRMLRSRMAAMER